jgi:hypothetical protein
MRCLPLVLLLAACGSSATTDALCAFCENDSQCGGNPCFQDVTGQHFCGHPCDSCPAGYTCQTVAGTSGLQRTCFPDSEACSAVAPPGGDDDAGVVLPPDGGMAPGIIVAGPVGATGGTVDRLNFGITGDTRPADCGSTYPQSVIDAIFDALKGASVQFALDQGDHMFNCGFSAAAFDGAEAQMARYVTAAGRLGKTVFMTMGNHECSGSATDLCPAQVYGANPNYTAYMDALRTVSDKPYYRFDVQTVSGKAVFLVVADDAWDATQKAWLEQQLTDADAHARYTFVSKHHPDGNTDHPEFQEIYDQVTAHKYTLFFTGHSHLYKRRQRVLVVGVGGAPLFGGSFFGYGTVKQNADDSITVTMFDVMTGNTQDQFTVSPQ